MHVTARPFATASLALVASSLIAVTPVASPPDLHRVASAAVRLADTSTDLLAGIDPVGTLSGLANDLGSLTNLGGLSSLVGDLGSLGGLTNELGGLNLGGLANIPYNVFADLVNIPYYESLALDEYAFALGPAGSVGGVPGWIAPGTAPSGIETINGLPYYALGGTGSWLMEAIGNTWGWDDGNWPQLDALLHFFLPFQFTESLAEQLQLLAQAEIIDGAAVNCEIECANVLGYVGGWFHTPLTDLLSGYTYPAVLADTIGSNSATGVVNVGPNPPGTDVVIWSGQHVTLDPLAPLEALAANLTGSPASNPIMFPDPADVISNLVKLGGDITNDFNPFETGSFLYWGAPTLYSVPAFLGGIVQSLTGIQNQFLIPPFQPYGAEPLSGYTDGPSSLLTGLPEGFEYLVQGLLGYLNPSTYLEAVSNDASTLSADLAGLLGDFSSLLPAAGANLAAMLGPDLATNLSSLLPNAGADLASMLGQELALNLGSLLPQLAMSFIPF